MKRSYTDMERAVHTEIISYGREELARAYETLLPYEQSRFHIAYRGLINNGLVVDNVATILLDLFHVMMHTHIRCNNQYARGTRVYIRDENPVLFEKMMTEYRRVQRQAIVDSRNALLEKKVPRGYIHVLSANVPTDGLGGIYPYDETIYDKMDYLYIPFNVMYMCVDVRDTGTILSYLNGMSTEKLLEMKQEADHSFTRANETVSFLSKLKSLLFDNFEILGR